MQSFNEKKMKHSQELEASCGSIEKQLNELERLISEKTKQIKNDLRIIEHLFFTMNLAVQ